MGSKVLRALVFLGLTAAAGATASVTPAAAQDNEAAFFKDKTVKFVVPFGPGGGYDAYARMLAPHLAKHLGATVVVENQPGAGGLTALGRLATSDPDGLTIMIVNGTGAAFAQLTGQSGVRFDLGKFGHLGTVSASPWMWLVTPNSPIKTPQDAMKPGVQISWSGGGPMDGLSDGAAFTCEALKLNCKIVLGYKGSSDAALAVARGEMDAIYVSDTSANNYVKSNQARAVATMGRERSRFFKDLPTIFEAVKLDADQQWLFDYRSTVENLGRILVTPPEVPKARLAFLQGVVKKTLTDPAVVAEGEKTSRYIDFLDAESTRKGVLRVISELTPEQKQRVVGILLKDNK
ncbi:MAG TPA: tripartite tricarboxylate transporter substrate binding protein [Hyphomicrobiaceae bacterium]|nr:tripartite tricarboxylate transporter substrate binding protein [Hyphomicrobiaceae bacterium]